MSSYDSQTIPTSELISSELFRPTNSCDSSWKYGRLIDKHNTNIVNYLLCNKISKGEIKWFKMHLAGFSGNVVKCGKVDSEVKKRRKILGVNKKEEGR
jgi:hypothetical protein